MNSERIERQFGSYGVDVVESGDRRRVSSLYSLAHGRKICRTWAVVEFLAPTGPDFAEEHELVRSGQSIGTVFKSAGWRVHKRHVRLGETMLTEARRNIADLMHLETPRTIALHSYVFEISRGGATHEYARITELHHPEYLDVEELRTIYDGASTDATARAG